MQRLSRNSHPSSRHPRLPEYDGVPASHTPVSQYRVHCMAAPHVAVSVPTAATAASVGNANPTQTRQFTLKIYALSV